MYFDINKQIKKALHGDAEQIYLLGLRYYLGEEVVKDYRSAQALFTQSAELGFVKAQFHLGLMYYEGCGIDKNYQNACHWFRKSADAGHIWSQFYIALMHRNNMIDGRNRKYLPDLWVVRSNHIFNKFSNVLDMGS